MSSEEVTFKVKNFFKKFPERRLARGEILIRPGEAPGGIFYLESGVVRQYQISKNGEDITLNIFKPGVFFPMSWAINNTENSYYYETTIPSSIRKATATQALDFVKNNPDVLFDLLSRVYRGTDGLLEKMAYLMAGSARHRLLENLIVLSKRFGSKNNDKVNFKVAEKDLAAQTGLTRETISRELGQMEKSGLIEFQRNNLTVISIKRLESELADYLS